MTATNKGILRVEIQASVGQKLLRVARLFNERAIEALQRRGYPLREAHFRLFPHFDFDGIRLTELASRAGITKQSAQMLVDEMVVAGYLKRRPDPKDGRAKLIVLTAKGIRGVTDGIAVLGSVEADVTEAVGPRKMVAFAKSLDAMLEVLDE